jgi:Protein of unknown function (DUF2796)
MRTTLFSSLTALAVIAAAPAAYSEEEHRELGAHVHGQGTLNIAVENNTVAMELEVPGMDIVGFEHDASSDAQKAALAKATADLAKPLTLFKLPAAAGCSVKQAKVNVEAEHGHADGDHADSDDDHAEAGHGHEEHADDHDHVKDHEGHGGHNQFHVTYALECSKPSDLASISFDYFKAFAGAQKLTVNVVTAKAQNSYQVSRDKPELDLGGMM